MTKRARVFFMINCLVALIYPFFKNCGLNILDTKNTPMFVVDIFFLVLFDVLIILNVTALFGTR